MRDFELADEDYLPASGSEETDASSSTKGTMPQSGFHFENFQAFISDSRTIVGIVGTICIAILIPILGNLCFKIYMKMNRESEYLPKCVTVSFERLLEVFNLEDSTVAEDETPLIEEDEEYEPEEPGPPKHVDFENVNPQSLLNITDEERILMSATMDADDQEFDILQTLNRVKLHGKLATAQLRAKTNRIETEMTDEEREQERKIRNEQLAKIFSMMEQQSDKFGMQSEDDLKEQMKLYNF